MTTQPYMNRVLFKWFLCFLLVANFLLAIFILGYHLVIILIIIVHNVILLKNSKESGSLFRAAFLFSLILLPRNLILEGKVF